MKGSPWLTIRRLRTSTRIDAFSVLGRFVVRAPWLMIAAWIVVVGVLAVAFPPLTKVVESQTVQPLPPKDMAAAEQMAKDFGESAQNILIVVLTDKRGLQPPMRMSTASWPPRCAATPTM